jgi:desulfoferrodoxin (superoxide reductase-like protein)
MKKTRKKTDTAKRRNPPALTEQDLRAATGAAFDGYVSFGEIKGESQEGNHKDWIEVLSYQHKMS